MATIQAKRFVRLQRSGKVGMNSTGNKLIHTNIFLTVAVEGTTVAPHVTAAEVQEHKSE